MLPEMLLQDCVIHKSHARAHSVTWIAHRTALRCFVAFLLLLVVCLGCHRGPSPVCGEVTFDGKPVDEGTISFEPADGKGTVTGGKIAAGKYELTGNAAPPSGKKIVRIFAVRKTGRVVTDRMTGTVDEVKSYIPDIYNSRSTLSCEVSRDGLHQIDFNLKQP